MEITQTLDRLKQNPYVNLIGRFCGVATVIGSVVSDVLRPLAPYALYASLAFGLAVPLIVLLHMLAPVDGLAKRLFGQYWDKPIMAAVFISAMMLMATHALSDRNPSGNGFLGSHFELVAAMQKDLGIVRESVVKIEEHTRKISENTQAISQDTRAINQKIDNVKRETSDDPRKELSNLGVTWSGDNFLNAVKEGDERIVTLFTQGGMNPEAVESQGRPLPVMLALNTVNPKVMLDILVGVGLDVNHTYEVSGAFGSQPMTLLGRAIEKGNSGLVKALIDYGVAINNPVTTFGAMGMPKQTYPLLSSVYWKHWDITQLLLEADADISVGDYAAYREVLAALKKPGSDVDREALESLRERVEPPNNDIVRIDSEQQLGEIEESLRKIAARSIMASPDSAQRQQYDQQYAELQQKRQRLRAQLGIADEK